jgi:hypothetical protein
MGSLTERLFPLPDWRRTPFSLLHWWESRRWFYNKAVGSAGLITLTGVFLLHPAREQMLEPAVALVVLAYGVVANACYTLGWLAEMVARLLWGRKAPDMGPLLFREGLIFSVGLTLFPLLVAVLFTIVRAVLGVLT